MARTVATSRENTEYPYFVAGLDRTDDYKGRKSVPIDQLDTITTRTDSPGGYIPSPDLAHAVNVALMLGMPLLITGAPGTGKTQLAYAVAHALSDPARKIEAPVRKFETKSTSQARDLFYTYDSLSAFKNPGATDPRYYIHYQALGAAILDAFPGSDPQVQALLPTGPSSYRHEGPRRSIVLIDEIDKAPRDFPNDLLNEIDRLYFRVPELQNLGTPEAIPVEYRPIVILTSNEERGLPDPFLRRCVFYEIPFPEEAEMAKIVSARLGELQFDRDMPPLLRDALAIFYGMQPGTGALSLRKPPSTAELLNWLQVLLARGVKAGNSLRAHADVVRQTLCTLVKKREDVQPAREYVDQWLSPKT